ncbi:MAG: hypothetical protein J6I66_00380 [Lachnospiraceae bacterium]|nr:hypothetical protein [Lachnospiraceae bacterium]
MKSDNVLILFDEDEEYAFLMGEYLLGCSSLPWKIAVCTSEEDLMKSCGMREPVIVTSSSTYRESLQRIGASKVIVLDDGAGTRIEPLIEKYQPAEETLRKILEIYMQDADIEPAVQINPSGEKARLIGVFSPVRRCYQTTFSVLMGRLLAGRGKVLYLSFEFCEGCEELIPPEKNGNLSDLMYFIKSPPSVFSFRFKSMVRTISGLDYIPCAVPGTDISEIPEEEWKTFLMRICSLEGYSYVILDLSECIRGIFGILRMCDVIYTLTRNDRVAKTKIESYENILRMYDYSDVREKSIKCSIPSVSRVPSFSGDDLSGELVDFIRKQMEVL